MMCCSILYFYLSVELYIKNSFENKKSTLKYHHFHFYSPVLHNTGTHHTYLQLLELVIAVAVCSYVCSCIAFGVLFIPNC